jgi:chromosome segregation ATPase
MSDLEAVEETQMGEEAQMIDDAQSRHSASPRAEAGNAPAAVDALGIVQQFKTAAERSFQMYQDLERQRQAIAREEVSVEALLRRQGELQIQLQDATTGASGDRERVAAAQQELERAQQALLAAQGQYASSALRVDVLNAQLRVVAAEIASCQERAAERRQVLHSMCAQPP